jgi:TolA-binding protein
MNFQTLIDQYPTHELVPKAQAKIAASFAAEGNRAAADSVYALVVQKYPASEDAPNALFKRARLAQDLKNIPQAIALFQQIVDKYPKSEERSVAADELQKLKKP